MKILETLHCNNCDSLMKCLEHIYLTDIAIRCIHFNKLKNLSKEIDECNVCKKANVQYSPDKVKAAFQEICKRMEK